MKPLRVIDEYLNGITMYRLLLYGLGLLAAVAVVFGLTGDLGFSAGALLGSLALLVPVCYVGNRVLAAMWPAAANSESALITALILFFILPPATDALHAAGLLVAALLAMASKYVIAWQRKHLFNPAAFAAVAVGLLGIVHATWWLATALLLPFVVLLGLLVLRKVRRMQLFLMFAATSLVVMAVVAAARGQFTPGTITQAFTVWPLVFLGTIMLTEPSTTPPRHRHQLVYGALVGALFASQLKWGWLSATPELALIIGNIYTYVVSPKYRLVLRLKQKTQLSPQVYDLAFTPERPIHFLPGQYMEWTLPHRHVDGRGNRRTFTIASSPTEKEVHIGIKTYQPSSSFKRALLAMEPGAAITAGQLAGDFTLPADGTRKLAFIAGGIGITPFRSMLKFLVDSDQLRDVVLFYIVSSPQEVSYDDVLRKAEKAGMRVVRIAASTAGASKAWRGYEGRLTPTLMAREVPDYSQRLFYLSGPRTMVDHYQDMLHSMQVHHIHTDYFSGY